jgi:hypothetical protein
MWDRPKELPIHLMAEAPAKQPERAGLVSETASRFSRGNSLNEVGPERLVLPLAWMFGLQKKPGLVSYRFWCPYHADILYHQNA